MMTYQWSSVLAENPALCGVEGGVVDPEQGTRMLIASTGCMKSHISAGCQQPLRTVSLPVQMHIGGSSSSRPGHVEQGPCPQKQRITEQPCVRSPTLGRLIVPNKI